MSHSPPGKVCQSVPKCNIGHARGGPRSVFDNLKEDELAVLGQWGSLGIPRWRVGLVGDRSLARPSKNPRWRFELVGRRVPLPACPESGTQELLPMLLEWIAD